MSRLPRCLWDGLWLAVLIPTYLILLGILK
jgi:hypothetical protein